MFKKGVSISSVLGIQMSRTLNIAREEIPETRNCEGINYLVKVLINHF
jgi:hypothetical protein